MFHKTFNIKHGQFHSSGTMSIVHCTETLKSQSSSCVLCAPLSSSVAVFLMSIFLNDIFFLLLTEQGDNEVLSF